jgi:GT2 family glycosyltransferase
VVAEDARRAEPRQAGISAIVVNHRRYDLLADCLASLTRSTRPPDEILVVDNASDVAQLNAVGAPYPRVRTMANASNPGFAVACNQGWRASAGTWLLFINPDVTVEPECIRQCLDELRSDPDIGVVTCRLVLPDGRIDHACHRGLPTPMASLGYKLRLSRLCPRSRRLGRYTMSWLDPGTVHDVEACSGAFMLIPRDIMLASGGWDEGYWFYGEDLDLCVRVAELGRRIRYVGTASAVHAKGASSHLRVPAAELSPDELATKRRVQLEIVRSHRRFFREHVEQHTPWLAGVLIRAMFTLQGIAVGLAIRADGVRGR